MVETLLLPHRALELRLEHTRQALLATPTHTPSALAAQRGTGVEDVRRWIGRNRHQLLVVTAEDLIPAFQLTDTADLDPVLAPVVAHLLADGLEVWHAWSWLTTPSAWTAGRTPADHLRAGTASRCADADAPLPDQTFPRAG